MLTADEIASLVAGKTGRYFVVAQDGRLKAFAFRASPKDWPTGPSVGVDAQGTPFVICAIDEMRRIGYDAAAVEACARAATTVEVPA